MEGTHGLHELREHGRMQWLDNARGWRAEPDDVVNALTADGFQECKRETARIPRAPATGGVWQGVDHKTGAVASPVICAVDRGMVKGMLGALYGDTAPETASSRAHGDATCITAVPVSL